MGPSDALAAWTTLMRRGDYATAWAIADRSVAARADRPSHHLPRHLQHVWDGRPLAGRRVLVRCYHGLGDTIQCVRFAPRLAAVASSVVWWVQPPLVPLLRDAPGVTELLPLHDGAPDARYDVDLESMELAHALRVTPDTLGPVPYLRVPPLDVPGAGTPRVGFMWRGGGWNPAREVPWPLVRTLARHPNIAAYALQPDLLPEEHEPWLLLRDERRTPLDTARLIDALDLVITVDTLIAHLAGALGARVWTLLPRDADWRWMEDRDDSPWYPTMRLFRQERAGEWEPVIARMAAALDALAADAGL
jgi:hypothetical protein